VQFDNYQVHDTVVRQVSRGDGRGNFRAITRVTTFVGPHGPFMRDFGQGEAQPYSVEAVNAWQQQLIAELRSIGGAA